jgi:hypothetical protein
MILNKTLHNYLMIRKFTRDEDEPVFVVPELSYPIRMLDGGMLLSLLICTQEIDNYLTSWGFKFESYKKKKNGREETRYILPFNFINKKLIEEVLSMYHCDFINDGDLGQLDSDEDDSENTDDNVPLSIVPDNVIDI